MHNNNAINVKFNYSNFVISTEITEEKDNLKLVHIINLILIVQFTCRKAKIRFNS